MGEKKKLAENYLKLQQKHSLPELVSLEHNFGLYDLESEKFPLVEIRKKMQDKIEVFIEILSNIIEGEPSLCNIYETKMINEEQKAEMFKLYKKLMKYFRYSNILSLSYDEKDEADFIKQFSSEWISLKNQLKKYLIMLKDSWDRDSETTDKILNYLG